jgi:hypothetical protein
MMLASFNPAFSAADHSTGDLKRDSLCSVISINSAFSLDYLVTPTDIDFENEDSVEVGNEISHSKDKLLNLDDDDAEFPSRKRRAFHLRDPAFSDMFTGESSNAMFFDGINDVRLSFDSDGGMELENSAPLVVGDAALIAFERARTLSAERRRIQSELLSRLECLDGIHLEIPMEPPTVAVFDGDEEASKERPEQKETEPRLGIYSEKERIERINAYREKRKQRVYGKVRYVLRQRVSESRPRVKGRFVKLSETASPTTPPDSSQDKSSVNGSPQPLLDTPTKRTEYTDSDSAAKDSPIPKRNRSTWSMLKNLTLLTPMRGKQEKTKRPSLPMTFSEKLLISRRKSTTAASTASGKARRKFSRDEFFEDDGLIFNEPERKRATSRAVVH